MQFKDGGTGKDAQREIHMKENRSPLKAIRRKCLECGTTAKSVKFCPCDGVNSTACPLWPFRFGCGLETAKRKYGYLLRPKDMPDANEPLEDCRDARKTGVGGTEMDSGGKTASRGVESGSSKNPRLEGVE